MTRHVVVIGAGIVGTSSAIALARDGHRVTLLESVVPGGRQAASYGNGAWISPASVVPMSMPGLWRKLPGYLRDPTGPFTIRPNALPALMPWLARFLWSGATTARVEATARHLTALLASAPDRHAALAKAAGVPDLIRRSGLLYVYPDRSAFEADARAWSLRRANGVGWIELGADDLARREPDLSLRYRFGALVEAGAHCADTEAYVGALAGYGQSLGVDLVRTVATGFDIRASRLRAVRTADGDMPCQHAVVAAGIGSRGLARSSGDRINMVSERGYHVVVPATGEASPMPRTPLMPSDGKMANTPTRKGLRVAGQVELSREDAPPDWNRAAILLGHLRRTFPGLPQDDSGHAVERWMGHRPSTPDGLPVIGPSRASPDIVYAFGHGHVGFAAGPVTGAAVADLIAGRASDLPLAAFRPSRFRWGL